MKIELESTKTYATEANAIRAVEKHNVNESLTYFINRTADGRFVPVFIGERAVQAGLHFHFSVVG